MQKEDFCEMISAIAIKSILYEVAATPKPGLVDRDNAGAHSDMDFFTFLNSTSVLGPYFYKCALAGADFKDSDYSKLLIHIRPIGIEAEKSMFKATCGINTHKGIVFSAGIIGAAAGTLYEEERPLSLENIIDRVKSISHGISGELKEVDHKEKLTYGEKLFAKHKSKGIRGEVEEGFPTVLKYSYPIFKELMEEKTLNINDILIQTLYHLIENTEDSNILGRHGLAELEFAKTSAGEALKLGGILSQEGRDYIENLDREFIEKNISPGGAADLLAVTLMLYMLENGDKI